MRIGAKRGFCIFLVVVCAVLAGAMPWPAMAQSVRPAMVKGWNRGVDRTKVQTYNGQGEEGRVTDLSARDITGTHGWNRDLGMINIGGDVWIDANLVSIDFCPNRAVATPNLGRQRSQPAGGYGSGADCNG